MGSCSDARRPARLALTLLAAALIWISGSAPGRSETVTLNATDGDLALTGELRAFDGRFYQIETEFGLMTVAGDRVYCSGAACPGDAETTGFTVSADQTYGRVLLPALVEAFAARQGLPLRRVEHAPQHVVYELGSDDTRRHFPVTLHLAGSAEAFADLAVGRAEMALVSRFPSDSEALFISDAGYGDLASPAQRMLLGVDALAVVVANGAPAQAVSGAPVGAELQGDLTARLASRLVPRPVEPPEVHVAVDPADLEPLFGPDVTDGTAVRHNDGWSVQSAVRDSRARVGLIPAAALHAGRVLPLVGSCGLALAPDRGALLTGDYPALIPALAYLPDRRLPRDMIGFISFLQSDEARRVMARAGVAHPDPGETVDVPLAGRLLAALAHPGTLAEPDVYRDLARTLVGARRLGLAFRAGAEASFDAVLSDLALDSLTEAVTSGTVPAEGLILGVFGGEAERRLAERIAAGVSEAAGGKRPAIHDFGAALPVACPEDPGAARLNARVEVWVQG